MTLPPETPPFSEGGPPQSSISPGDYTRELIHEVRNLSTQVALLHTIFVKRKVLYWILGVETFIVACVLVALSLFVANEHSNTQHLINKLVDSCQVRNVQVEATKTYLTRSVKINAEASAYNSELLSRLHIVLTPKEQAEGLRIEQDYIKSLNDYLKAQPTSVPCKNLK